MKVVKFGGSSVANAKQIHKVANIIKDDPERKIIIVSAPGKRFDTDKKLTDLLIKLCNAHINNEPYGLTLDQIISRFAEIIKELHLSDEVLKNIEQTIYAVLASDDSQALKMDRMKAIGEDSSAKIVSAYLKMLGLNAIYLNPYNAGIIVSNEPGNARLLPESYAKIFKLREREEILVIPGFFGYTPDGILATFSRGGSDISGSIVAAGVKADLYENFTDVDSVFAVNPTIIKQPAQITTLTYKEMRELSYAGFSVIHDEALIPAFQEKIPVAIKNTNNPHSPGTMIVAEKASNGNCVVGIASDSGFCTVYVSKYLMNRELGFGRKLFHIFEDEGVSFEHAPSGIDDMSVVIRENQLTPQKEQKIINRIYNELNADMVTVHHDLAIIMVVGEGMMNTIGIAQKATMALAEANVNIEMINQGSSEVSMMFGVQTKDLDKAVKSLYNVYFS